jgi:hypothetical protein
MYNRVTAFGRFGHSAETLTATLRIAISEKHCEFSRDISGYFNEGGVAETVVSTK